MNTWYAVLRTAVPFWGQIFQIPSRLSPPQVCNPDRIRCKNHLCTAVLREIIASAVAKASLLPYPRLRVREGGVVSTKSALDVYDLEKGLGVRRSNLGRVFRSGGLRHTPV